MKILQVCAYTAQYGGNFIACLRSLDALLQKQGVETAYLFPETVKDTPWCKQLRQSNRVFFAGMNRFSMQTFRQVRTAMEDADIIHSHFELYDCLCALARKKKQKLFWHLHDSFDEEIDFLHRLINRLQYGVFGKKAFMISPSRFYADYTVKLGFPAKQVHIVENAIDCDRLGGLEEERRYDFFAFGGFYKIKGLDVLLDACRALVTKGYAFTVGIVGYENTWKYIDANYPDLHPYIVRENPSEDVRSFYTAAGAFISASRRECFSYALLEALYLKCPVIASEIVGNQWVKRFGNTASFESGNSTALAERMEQFLKKEFWFTDEVLEETALAVSEQYSAEKWAKRIKEIYFGT